jgi:dTDP-4-amino-4,6-dideoxygalactose transaminase
MREIPFGRPMIGEEEKQAVSRILDGPILTHGPKVKEFEKDFSNYVKGGYSVALSSCTAALQLSYFYLGIGSGDEVIVPAQTHTATAHAVELCGGKPVFIDAEKNTGNIDIDQMQSAITERTKAISIVHYLGMPVDMDRVMKIAKKHHLFVVEDCALAIGTYFKGVHAGLHGDTGCFSFYPVKHMTTAEGGMLVTKHKEVSEKISRQRAFGVDRSVGERKIPGVYDVTMLGFNYRMSEIQAALGVEQLKRMEGFLKKRKENYELLSKGFREIDEVGQLMSTHGDYQSSYYCLSIILEDRLVPKRFEIIESLKEKGVGTSIYYPQPVPHFSYYKKKYGYSDDSFPVASWISNVSIAFSVGPHINREDIGYIVEEFKNAIREVR